jgi:hypothetical protein
VLSAFRSSASDHASAIKITAGSSSYKGVSWDQDAKKWRAKIHVDGKQKHLGVFGSEETAARKYDEVAASMGRPRNFPVAADSTSGSGAGASAMKKAKATARGYPGLVGDPAAFKGIFWEPGKKKWAAKIRVAGFQVLRSGVHFKCSTVYGPP